MQTSGEQPEQGLAARILQYQCRLASIGSQYGWAGRPGGIEIGPQRVFAFETLYGLDRWMLP
jgi:hypothetical protein